MTIDFRSTGYPLRLYSGKGVVEKLPSELHRLKAQRAFIVCVR